VSHAASPFRRPDAHQSDSADTEILPPVDISFEPYEAADPAESVSPSSSSSLSTVSSPAEPDLLAQPLDDDLNERITKAAPRRLANRATYALAGLALLVVGFVGGAQVQKSYGTAPAASTPAGGVNPAALASAFANRGQGGGGTGAQAGTGSGRSGVTGTVKLVDGTTVYVETADGTTVIVKTSGTTTVSAPGALKDLTAGSTVTVQGQTADGAVTATSITKTK
jgi:hypothetical protein